MRYECDLEDLYQFLNEEERNDAFDADVYEAQHKVYFYLRDLPHGVFRIIYEDAIVIEVNTPIVSTPMTGNDRNKLFRRYL